MFAQNINYNYKWDGIVLDSSYLDCDLFSLS